MGGIGGEEEGDRNRYRNKDERMKTDDSKMKKCERLNHMVHAPFVYKVVVIGRLMKENREKQTLTAQNSHVEPGVDVGQLVLCGHILGLIETL